MSAQLQLPVRAVDHPRAAVAEADVIGVVSNAREPVLDAEWVRPGTLVFSLASGQLPAELIRRTRVIVSAREEVATRREPYASMAAAGTWDRESIGEFGDVVLGKIPGRVRDDEIVVYEMPGMSIWDTAIVAWVYPWAMAHEVGTPIHLSSQ